MSWKNSLPLPWQMLGLFLNTLAADEKYPLLKRGDLTVPIQMQLSQRQKAFAQFLAEFLKFILNLEYFEIKYEPHRICISEIKDLENVFK